MMESARWRGKDSRGLHVLPPPPTVNILGAHGRRLGGPPFSWAKGRAAITAERIPQGRTLLFLS
jgi:hypothetical protein